MIDYVINLVVDVTKWNSRFKKTYLNFESLKKWLETCRWSVLKLTCKMMQISVFYRSTPDSARGGERFFTTKESQGFFHNVRHWEKTSSKNSVISNCEILTFARRKGKHHLTDKKYERTEKSREVAWYSIELLR